MRALTQEEQAELDCRYAAFEKFLDERMPVLTAFMNQFELPNPAMVLVETERFLPPLDQWMRNQVIASSERAWILTRIGYFIGEYLVQKFSGCWFVNDIPDSRYFARYVVGRFGSVRNPNAMIDPFEMADAYVQERPGRSLSNLLASVEAELRYH